MGSGKPVFETEIILRSYSPLQDPSKRQYRKNGDDQEASFLLDKLSRYRAIDHILSRPQVDVKLDD